MKTVICPISPLRVARSTVRITGFMVALMIGLYALTGDIIFIGVILIDYFIRAWTTLTHSPLSWLAEQLTFWLDISTDKIDKAPKIFAARVGFLFALTAVLLFPFQPFASLIVALTLMCFALLESVFDLCVGCLVYTYIVFPLVGE